MFCWKSHVSGDIQRNTRWALRKRKQKTRTAGWGRQARGKQRQAEDWEHFRKQTKVNKGDQNQHQSLINRRQIQVWTFNHLKAATCVISSTWPGQEVVDLGKLHCKQLPRHTNPYLIHHAAWKVPFSMPLPSPALLLPQGHQRRIPTATAWAFTLKECISLEWSMQFLMAEHFKQCESGAKSRAKSLSHS